MDLQAITTLMSMQADKIMHVSCASLNLHGNDEASTAETST